MHPPSLVGTDHPASTLCPNPSRVRFNGVMCDVPAAEGIFSLPICYSRARSVAGADPPPLKWSTLSYGFALKEDRNAEEELQAGGDRREAAAG